MIHGDILTMAGAMSNCFRIRLDGGFPASNFAILEDSFIGQEENFPTGCDLGGSISCHAPTVVMPLTVIWAFSLSVIFSLLLFTVWSI